MLSGIRVIEMATHVAAPGAGGLLADWGAEVIKIEPPAGCPIRGMLPGPDGEPSPMFGMDNRGKKSVVIDTRTAEGVDAVKRLVKEADIFLTNVRPAGLARSGLDYAALSAVNPRLIYVTVTGYGLEGPDRDTPAFDTTAFFARSGLLHLSTVRGQAPTPNRFGVGDHTTGLTALGGALAALVSRQLTGKGRLVDASLLRAGIYTASSELAFEGRYGDRDHQNPREHAGVPEHNFFKTRDGRWIGLFGRPGKDWANLCRALDAPELASDPRFTEDEARKANGPALVAALDAIFATRDFADWTGRLNAVGMNWAPVQRPGDAFTDPQILAVGGVRDMPVREGEPEFKTPAGPVRFSDFDDGPKGPMPKLGEHTDAVMRLAGFTDAEIADMRRRKTIL